MSITLSFSEQDLRDGLDTGDAAFPDAVAIAGIAVIIHGGIVCVTDSSVATHRQMTDVDSFKRWMENFRKRRGIMTISEEINAAFSGPSSEGPGVRDRTQKGTRTTSTGIRLPARGLTKP